MWNGFEGIGWGWIGVGAFHMVLFWALVLGVLLGTLRWLAGTAASPGENRPLELLKARYARGELAREQFEQMKRELAD